MHENDCEIELCDLISVSITHKKSGSRLRTAFLMAHDSPNKIRFANFVMLRATFLKEES